MFDSPQFDIEFLEEAMLFLEQLDRKTYEKVLENIRMAQFRRSPRLLKKLDKHIWEFRTHHSTKQVRLLAFWSPNSKSLIICTHGFIKKTQKTPSKHLKRAHELRKRYLDKE